LNSDKVQTKTRVNLSYGTPWGVPPPLAWCEKLVITDILNIPDVLFLQDIYGGLDFQILNIDSFTMSECLVHRFFFYSIPFPVRV
jgi:hypothetical protein